MSSSVLGIGAALSALVWIGVLSFIVAAWVDDRRRGLDEPESDWSRQDARRTTAEPAAGTLAQVDLADVDGIDLTAPARPIDLTPTADVATADLSPPEPVIKSEAEAKDKAEDEVKSVEAEPPAREEPVARSAEADAPTWSARSESELRTRPADANGGESGSWLRYLGVLVLLAVARRVVTARRLRL